MTVKSVYYEQDDVLSAIMALYVDKFDADFTYGNGSFWRSIEKPRLLFDIQPLHDGVVKEDSTCLSLPDDSVGHSVYDPPFLTYVRQGREGNGDMAMAKRYGGFWTYDELSETYSKSLSEFYRVLKDKSILVFKCQDIVHNHKLHLTHCLVVNCALSVGFRLEDVFILVKDKRMPAPNRKGAQKHARIHHCYYLVLRKV